MIFILSHPWTRNHHSGVINRNWPLNMGYWLQWMLIAIPDRFFIPDSWLLTPDSWLLTPDSWLLTPDSWLIHWLQWTFCLLPAPLSPIMVIPFRTKLLTIVNAALNERFGLLITVNGWMRLRQTADYSECLWAIRGVVYWLQWTLGKKRGYPSAVYWLQWMLILELSRRGPNWIVQTRFLRGLPRAFKAQRKKQVMLITVNVTPRLADYSEPYAEACWLQWTLCRLQWTFADYSECLADCSERRTWFQSQYPAL